MKTKAQPFKVLLNLLVLTHALILPPSFKVSAQQGSEQMRDARREAGSSKVKDGKFVPRYEKSYALVIGASEYTAGWSKLPGVKKDVEAVSVALERHGFQVTLVMNPDATLLEKSFRDFIAEHGMNVENRLLIYFAGHGHTLKQSYGGDEMGYIVPVDAPRPEGDANLAAFRTKALSMRRVELYAEEIQAKHALFVFDSCFSGSFFVMKSGTVPKSISSKTDLPVRQFITSGSAEERVPDDSIFRRQFVEAIEGAADLNPKDGYVTGSELGPYLQDKVVNSSRNPQHPQFGTIRNANLNRGDFVFSLPNAPILPAANNNPTPAMTGRADTLAAEQELEYWKAIRDSKDPQDYEGYLKKYPNGQFAVLARQRAQSTSNRLPDRDNDLGTLSSPPALNQSVRISGVSCMCEQFVSLKVPNSLLILGSGWDGGSDVKVIVNGKDISAHLESQDALISMKGTIRELNLRDGRNEVVITVNGITSNTYVFKQAIK